MEAGVIPIMVVLVILAVIYALVSGTHPRKPRDYEEKIQTIEALLEEEAENERRNRAAEATGTLTDIVRDRCAGGHHCRHRERDDGQCCHVTIVGCPAP